MKNITLEHFEQIEADVEECCALLDTDNHPGLVQHWREILERDPSDINAVLALAEAFVLNSQYQDSIAMLTPYYRQAPEESLYAHAILDALFAMGKTSQDFSSQSENPDRSQTCISFPCLLDISILETKIYYKPLWMMSGLS